VYEGKFGNLTILNIQCKLCKETYAIKVKTEDYTDYYNSGKLIQLCFPYLTAGERELIISGMCDSCFNNIFKNEEDDE